MTQQSVKLKLRQTQQLNQKQQQSLRILHMSSLELAEEVEGWLADNPMLERPEADPFDNSAPEPHYSADLPVTRKTNSMEESDVWETVADEADFRGSLHEQVCEHPLDKDQAARVHLLIDYLDDQGYLNDSLTDIVENSPLEWMLDEDELAEALRHLQQFDPAGVGARDLGESLLLQLARQQPNEAVFCAVRLVKHFLPEVGKNSLSPLVRKKFPEYSVATIEAAQALVASLNPFPAYGYAGSGHTEYVDPDVWIRPDPESGEWKVGMFRQAWPQVQLNQEYCDLLAEYGGDAPELKQKLSEAKVLLSSLEQRKSTVLRLAEIILEKQADFFSFGAIGLVPLTIKDTAAHLGLAESTVSRAVNQKYLACPQGIFPLRYFFSQAAAYSGSEDSDGISPGAVKAVIESLIAAEDKTKPLSDRAMADRLSLQGIVLARRTVAKYREELNFPPAHQRKQKAGS
ncbi:MULTISPECIES: RNA polymerase factor sigma-54 [Eikenella]|uniref:RNA polymerase sigma-54 factor n=1 Tax=Eikenella longinqua TaxID=1795827 RepID=A0A1A9RY74_9NEIS|nr:MULTISPECIES: RNA polymerase factor sigma-54 [Eikenella]OAM29090.1 RNA polymerase sigma-54 factor [Eikenella longinqua]